MAFLIFPRKSKKFGARRFADNRFQKKIRDARKTRRPIQLEPGRKPHPARKMFSNFARALAVIIISLAVIAVVYLVFFSDYFIIRSVQIEGAAQLDSDDLANLIKGYSSQKFLGIVETNNWLFLNKNRIENLLKSKTPQILSVTDFQRAWPDTLRLSIEERAPVFVWKSGDEFYKLDRTGTIYESFGGQYATTTDPLVVVDSRSQRLTIGENLDLGALLDFMRSFQQEWLQKIKPALAYYEFDPQNKNQFTAVTEPGWVVFIDTAGQDAPLLVENLRLLLDQEIGLDKNQNLSYIDLRIPQKAYYCYKDEPCSLFEAEKSAP